MIYVKQEQSCLELFHLGKSHVAPIIHISDKNFLKMIDSVQRGRQELPGTEAEAGEGLVRGGHQPD